MFSILSASLSLPSHVLSLSSVYFSGPNGEFDISNKGRIGASEVELVQRMIDGVDKLIDMEEKA